MPPGAPLALASRLALPLLLSLAGCRPEEPIRLAPEARRALEDEREELLGRSLTQDERAALGREWVEQEVLVREAYRLGLDKDDGVVRQRLLQRMRLLLAEKPREPTRDDLVAYYDGHRERYRSPELVSLDHVMVSRTEGGGAGQAAALLAALRGGAEFRTLGQRFWLGPSLALLSEAELGRVLGDAFAREVFALPGNDWSGPLESIRGLHLVRVTSRRPPLQRPFEEVSGQVREDWLEVLELEALRRKVTEISRRYRIEGLDSGAGAR